MQNQQTPGTRQFPTRVILAIAVGKKLQGVRLCDMESVINHIVPLRQPRFHEIETYAFKVLRFYIQKHLPFLKDVEIPVGETDEQFVDYHIALYGETLSLEGGEGAFLMED